MESKYIYWKLRNITNTGIRDFLVITEVSTVMEAPIVNRISDTIPTL